MKARDLKPGDAVLDADGNAITVAKTGPGFGRGSVLIEWREAWAKWSCLDKETEIKQPE